MGNQERRLEGVVSDQEANALRVRTTAEILEGLGVVVCTSMTSKALAGPCGGGAAVRPVDLRRFQGRWCELARLNQGTPFLLTVELSIWIRRPLELSLRGSASRSF